MGLYQSFINYLSGHFYPTPTRGELPVDLMQFVQKWQNGQGDQVIDYHLHLLGLGHNESGCRVHQRMLQPPTLKDKLTFDVYMSAAGITDPQQAETQYLEQLRFWADEAGGRYVLLGMDDVFKPNGEPLPQASEFYIPADYCWSVCNTHAERFLPAVSIHPYRTDALSALEDVAKRGGRIIKWLPNSQRMDPADPNNRAFYEKMAQLNLILLSHTGHEAAVEGGDFQEYGNPLRLKLPLDCGVRVIAAHCASDGLGDHPTKGRIPNFELLDELLREPAYKDLIFTDISATIQSNRIKVFREILQRPHWYDHMIYGSDYPLPAVNAIISVSKIRRLKLINRQEAKQLKALYRWNPLLFDQLVKRVINYQGYRLPEEVFTRNIF